MVKRHSQILMTKPPAQVAPDEESFSPVDTNTNVEQKPLQVHIKTLKGPAIFGDTVNVNYNFGPQEKQSNGNTEFLKPTPEEETCYTAASENEQFQELIRCLDLDRRALLSVAPGNTRSTFISALCCKYKRDGYTCYNLTSISKWYTKGPRDREQGSFVVVDTAFGIARLEKKQYDNFNQYSLHSNNSKTIFVVYPHILKELETFDHGYQCPILKTMQTVKTTQETNPVPEPYYDLFVRMMRDPKHGLVSTAVLALAMQGLGHFLNNVGQAQPLLKRFGFEQYSDAHLQQYASLLEGFVLSKDGNGFANRVFHDAAGFALASCSPTLLLRVCDVRFFVQNVHDPETPEEYGVVVTLDSDDGRLLMERIFCDLAAGHLQELSQHSLLHGSNFLKIFGEFCKEKGYLQRVISAVDKQHSLPLLYWSVWGPSSRLTQWCLDVAVNLNKDDSVITKGLKDCISTVIALELKIRTDRTLAETHSTVQKKLLDLVAQCNQSSMPKKINLPLLSVNQRITDNAQTLQTNVESIMLKPLHYTFDTSLPIPQILLTLQLSKEQHTQIEVSFLIEQQYLALRLLTDHRVDEQDADGNTVLHLAANARRLEAITLAVESGASLLVKNQEGLVPPQLSANRLNESRQNKKRKQGWVNYWRNGNKMYDLAELSSFNEACKNGRFSDAKVLLCHSVAHSDKDKFDMTPLHYASRWGKTGLVELLINLQANTGINATNYQNETPLLLACEFGFVETANLLISKGANVNIQDRKGWSPLHAVSWNGRQDTANELLAHGAQVDLRCEVRWKSDKDKVFKIKGFYQEYSSFTPFAVACLNEHWEIAKLLLERGSDINTNINAYSDPRKARQPKGRQDPPSVFTLLHKASVGGFYELADFLLNNGAKIEERTSDNQTALFLACSKGHEKIATLLITKKAKVNEECSSDDITALHIACHLGHKDTVQILLQNGAEVNVFSRCGKSPLQLACDRGHTAVVGLLLPHKDRIRNRDLEKSMNVATSEGHKVIVESPKKELQP